MTEPTTEAKKPTSTSTKATGKGKLDKIKMEVDNESPPAGYVQQSGDLEAYWDSDSPETRNSPAREGLGAVHFTPLYVSLMDSKIESRNTSTLLFCRLESPCVLRVAGDTETDEAYEEFPQGTLFGIWTKPGMAKLRNLAGVRVWMRNNGFKEIGKPSPMCLFDIRSETESGNHLRIMDDRRDKSLPPELRKSPETAAASNADFIPF